MKQISVQELKAKIEQGEAFHLVDVRETDEYNEYNIGGELMPLSNIRQYLENGDFEDMAADEQDIILYCRSGQRSLVAQALLAEINIPAINLKGGILAWKEAFGDERPKDDTK